MFLTKLYVIVVTTLAYCHAQSENSNDFSNVSLQQASSLKVPAILDNSTQTVVFPVYPGTDLTKLAPTFNLPQGSSSTPSSGQAINLSNPVTYTFSNGNSRSTWTFSATQMNSPALPGLYADPNIVNFNGTYYIYTTTDGYPGWGGQTFYVWYSKDLYNWSRTTNPILTLNGTSGNVPWSNGNAWAPTIHQRYGKYYLYFSGNNIQLGYKTIGVAVASSPLGPFKAQPKAMITNTEAYTTNQAIDPAAFVDPKTGKYYLFWGNGSPLLAELADNMTSINQSTLQRVSGLTDFTEASFVVYRAPYYHYTYSNGNTGAANYYVAYATSTSVTGPWTYRGTILQEDATQGILATGSSSNVNVPGTDNWYIAYHRFRIPDGDGTDRETCIDKLNFDSNTGLIQTVKPTLSGILSPV